ncbi:MAG: PorT family protein [Bacteroidales bacterium]|nr:PorT family protein [Bacteroidales bacterium]
MKRSLLTIALIMWAGILAIYGQFPSSFGAKAGISLANQTYKYIPIDYTMETEPVVGPALSLFVEAFKGAHFSLQVDLSYLVKGSKSSTESVTVDHLNNDRIIVNEGEQSTSTFKYLSIAPMARYRLGQGSLQPYFLLGPRVDILLNYETDSEYPLDEQNNVIPGLTFGTGLEYRLNNLGLFAELQYQGDFFPVTGQDPLLVNNHMISFTLGLRWLVSE